MTDDVKMPSMDAAMLTALTPSLQPTGEHKALPDGYCPDCCGAPCLYGRATDVPVAEGLREALCAHMEPHEAHDEPNPWRGLSDPFRCPGRAERERCDGLGAGGACGRFDPHPEHYIEVRP